MTSTHSGVRLWPANGWCRPALRANSTEPSEPRRLDGCGQLAKLEIPGTTIVGAQSMKLEHSSLPKEIRSLIYRVLPPISGRQAIERFRYQFEVWMPARDGMVDFWAIA